MDEIDELLEALKGYQACPTSVEDRQRAHAAIERYMEILRPLVGGQLAAQFNFAYSAFIAAAERFETLIASYQRIGGLQDDGDAEFLAQIKSELDQAEQALDRVAAEVVRVLGDREPEQ